MGGTTIVLMTTIAVQHPVVAQRVPLLARFEVASVRPVDDASSTGWIRVTPRGQLVGQSPLKNLIILAYGAEPYERVVGADSDTSRSLEQKFEVNALPPESSTPFNRGEVNAMTRQMLAERFGLKVRIDSELVSATVLREIKPGVLGPGLRPAPEGCTQSPPNANPYDDKFAESFRRGCVLTLFGGRARGTVTLDEFARVVSFATQRPILNRTALEGMFTFDAAVDIASLGLAAPSPLGARVLGPAGPSDVPAFVDALRDQMGLSARTERQSVRLFVVEHVGPLVEN